MAKTTPDQEELRKRDERIAGLRSSLEDALAKLQSAEERLTDQESRLKKLGRGREETLLELSETRAQLERVKAERDGLQSHFDDVEAM